MRNALATRNLVAVSAERRETALNAFQELDTLLACGLGDGLELVPHREAAQTQTGHEEPACAPLAYLSARGALTFERAQPHHFALLLGYGLGQVVSEPFGSGFRHTITPLAGDCGPGRSNPSFTLAQRYAGVLARRFASVFIDKFSATFARGEWCALSAGLVATGRCEGNLVQDELSSPRAATELTLTQAVEGTSAAERLASVHQVRAELAADEWHEVAVLAASADIPARLTIAPPGGGGECRYRVLYVAAEPAWTSFPAQLAESPLHISRVALTLGGRWDGAQVLGGRTLAAELRRLEWSLTNHFELSATPGTAGCAGLALRGRREQRLSLLRDLRCGSLQHALEGEESFCLHLVAQGAPFAPGEPYQVELVFPRLALLAAAPGARGTRLTEECVCLPLEGEETPSVVARVTNLQSSVAA